MRARGGGSAITRHQNTKWGFICVWRRTVVPTRRGLQSRGLGGDGNDLRAFGCGGKLFGCL